MLIELIDSFARVYDIDATGNIIVNLTAPKVFIFQNIKTIKYTVSLMHQILYCH